MEEEEESGKCEDDGDDARYQYFKYVKEDIEDCICNGDVQSVYVRDTATKEPSVKSIRLPHKPVIHGTLKHLHCQICKYYTRQESHLNFNQGSS